MKLTFELVAATDINTFNELVNAKLAENYKFITGQLVTITPHEQLQGSGYQYSVALLLEEDDNAQAS